MPIIQSRRDFLASASLAAAASMLGGRGSLADEAPLETTRVRLMRIPTICWAPQYVAGSCSRAEGFTEVRYVSAESAAAVNEAVAEGRADINRHFASQSVNSDRPRRGESR